MPSLEHMDLLPWAIAGLVIVIGVATAAIAKLPWVTKLEAELKDQIWEERMKNLQGNLTETSQICRENARQITGLVAAVAVLERNGRRT